ncbi:DUF4395 domain-containing protein [Lacisediminihabitans profunda]|uniref:DUF4395 domain-containing protein n=1 Tax=Lacisediminihabitans profunda TaxID=2594790 RepID=A0A5C8UU94_9MICO|nr:DUF4395 domain-containing protein [Lacisediminihabitans profunda]TXN31523.1 DUF4395 domain-containing protein [Lacisediminihabitans profunda]
MTAPSSQPTLPPSKRGLVAAPGRSGIDPRGPRFSAGITAVLLLLTIALGLGSAATPPTTLGARAGEPAFILFAIITALFAWGAFAGVRRHPYGWLFKTLVRPRLAAPGHLEDPAPPTFSQGVGLFVTLIGVLLHLAGVPFGLVIFAALAFVAAFLNSVFDYCLGCQIYLLLLRGGVFKARPVA